MKDSIKMNNQVVIYETKDGAARIDAYVMDGDIWLTSEKMAQLFGKARPTILEHVKNIYAENELDVTDTKRKVGIPDNSTKPTDFYNLSVIIAVGYRVKSPEGTSFRQWATGTLKSFVKQGYVLDKKRLVNGQMFGEDYFDQLVEEIQEIRASERRIYQKITDIYATAFDYNADAETTKRFFATVQNKLHFAIHRQTAAEVIAARADHKKSQMGLTSWRNAPVGKILKGDVAVAKNYLSASEVKSLNEIVTMYLDYAMRQARRQAPMSMIDWVAKLDAFLEFNDEDILKDAGKISATAAKRFAESEYKKYRVAQDKAFESDFDRAMLELDVRKGGDNDD
jgi:hypothetical protein